MKTTTTMRLVVQVLILSRTKDWEVCLYHIAWRCILDVYLSRDCKLNIVRYTVFFKEPNMDHLYRICHVDHRPGPLVARTDAR